jgi:hypothetical protein
MTLDLSVVNRIAAQCGINAPDFKTSNTYMALPGELLEFSQAIYEMGAAEQKEKDADICEEFYSVEGVAQKCAESIRSQE